MAESVDAMTGGSGDDTYFIDTLLDSITEGGGAGANEVWASTNYTLSANLENLVLSGKQPRSVHG